jgi:hypothetical protein
MGNGFQQFERAGRQDLDLLFEQPVYLLVQAAQFRFGSAVDQVIVLISFAVFSSFRFGLIRITG